jgi:pimeloyl-ACP methyl ester carboxylesterase
VERIEVDTGAVVLEIAEAGKGGEPLLLLHGFTGAKEDFDDWLDAFAASGFHVVAPDQRGHGRSGKPVEETAYSLATFAEDGRGLVDALGWERFALLGHSMGGMVAQHLALAVPERLTALVLMDTTYTTVTGIDPDLAAVAVEVVRTDGLPRLFEMLDARESPLTSPADARVRAEREGYIEFGERKFLACSPAMYAAMAVELLAQVDRLERLSTLHVPTLVVVGEQDTPFLAPSQAMAEAMPDARLAVVPDAGHSPQFEAPERWWDEVNGFLEQVVLSPAQPRGSR